MPLKILKNSKRWLAIALLIVWAGIAAFPTAAHAYDFANPYGVYNISEPANTLDPASNRVCLLNSNLSLSDNLQRYGLVKRLILCVRESTVSAVSSIIEPFSKFFSRTIAIMCSLAVVFWGVLVASGKRSAPTREAMTLGMKIGLVIMFTSNFAALYFDPRNKYGGFFGLMLDTMGQMLTLVSTYSPFYFSTPCSALSYDRNTGFYVDALTGRGDLAIWDFIDCTLDSLIGGIFSPLTLTGGTVGFFISCIISNVVGLFVGILGLMLIWMFLKSIAQAVYIFISSYIALSIMVLVSPIFIPMVLFTATKAYTEKWLRLTIGFMLQPIFIFVYITLFMTAFDITLFSGQRSVVSAVLGVQATDPDYASRGFGNYLLWRGYYSAQKMGESAVQMNNCEASTPGCQTPAPSDVTYDSGVLGVIGQSAVKDAADWQNDIYNVYGDSNIFRTSIPFTGVNWDDFVINHDVNRTDYADLIDAYVAYDQCRKNPSPSCATQPDPLNYLGRYYEPYITQLILALIMAVVTTYIFMIMLEYLPFIGSGISGESLSVPTFGVGNLAPIGGGLLRNIQGALGGLVRGGG